MGLLFAMHQDPAVAAPIARLDFLRQQSARGKRENLKKTNPNILQGGPSTQPKLAIHIEDCVPAPDNRPIDLFLLMLLSIPAAAQKPLLSASQNKNKKIEKK